MITQVHLKSELAFPLRMQTQIQMRMQGRRETTHKAPRFFSRLPRTPSTLFPLPLTVQRRKRIGEPQAAIASFFFGGNVEGKRKGVGGCGRGGEKLLGPYMVFPRPSRIAFDVFAFEPLTQSRPAPKVTPRP